MSAWAAAPASTTNGPHIVTAAGYALSPAVRGLPASANSGREKREKPLLQPSMKEPPPGRGGGTDGALQTSATVTLGTTAVLSFDGVGVGITPGYTDCCAPPDTNAAVGATQVVQWVNLDFAVFDKMTGALLAGPTPGNAVFANLTAGNCNTNNDGDPIVQYDRAAGRWILTQFSVTGGPPFFQCIAVSTSSDATGTYNTWAFSFGSDFPDYPKLGVWPDAYYMSFNMFLNGRSFAGADACAFDRGAMIAGSASPVAVCFQQGKSIASLLPSHLDGATQPPPRSPNLFMNFGTNSLNLFKFHVNFTTPSNSTFTGPTSLATAAFSTACDGGTCVPQAGTTNTLDSLADRLMYRLAYRNFVTGTGAEDHEALVVTHSVAGSGTAAPRWYELRSPGNGGFTIFQQSSYAPDSTYRWMGSAAIDKFGDIAVGYSASSGSINPAIRYTGRQPTDALGQLRQEALIFQGAGSQTGTLHRWGDYSSMALDPVDDCTFWYTTEYLQASGSFNWSTRLFSFKFPGC